MTKQELSKPSGRERGAFEVLPCNRGAHDLSMDFAHGHERFGVISGPHGCGKSHLLRETAFEAHKELGASVALISASEVSRPGYGFSSTDILVIDDLGDGAGSGRSKKRLEVELERRVRSGKPTFCAATVAFKAVSNFLPFPRKWRKAEIHEPTDSEREGILRSICRAERLDLPEEVVKTVVRLIPRDGRALLGAVKRLKFACKNKSEPISQIRAAGVLDPLISKGSGFDLRDIVVDCVSLSLDSDLRRKDDEFQYQLSTYVMRDEAWLAESSVAEYLGFTPGETFRILRDARNRLQSNDAIFSRKLESTLRLICKRLDDV